MDNWKRLHAASEKFHFLYIEESLLGSIAETLMQWHMIITASVLFILHHLNPIAIRVGDVEVGAAPICV